MNQTLFHVNYDESISCSTVASDIDNESIETSYFTTFEDEEEEENAETKEDYEQTILYFKMDGGVLRFNNVTAKTKFNSPGGLGTDRYERNKKAAEYLQDKYPDIITVFKRKNGTYEVKLARLS